MGDPYALGAGIYSGLPAYNENDELFDLAKFEQKGSGYIDGAGSYSLGAQAGAGAYIDPQPQGGFNSFQ